LIRISYKLLID